MWKICAVFVLSVFTGALTAKPCIKRGYGSSSVVCVCNKTYCDGPEAIADSQISGGRFLRYTSSMGGYRLKPDTGSFSEARSAAAASAVFTVEPNTTYQEMMGFGGALTDSAAFNIYNLSEQTRENLIKSYFGEGGAQYLYVRLNMGACDFSLKYYTYDEVPGDMNLTNFSLIDIDYKYKIPIIRQASKMRGLDLKLFATPWTAPRWMRFLKQWYLGHLFPEYYQAYADYFVKYFDAYKEEGVEFWGLTPQNEPTHYSDNYPVMGWNTTTLNEFVGKHLGPALDKAGYSGLQMMAVDDNRNHLPGWADETLNDSSAGRHYSGVAVHWYEDTSQNAPLLTTTHERHPDKYLFYTEACNNVRLLSAKIGEWEVGEKYGVSMIQAFNNWVSGWVDYNMALNTHGGPSTFSGNSLNFGYNAAILVDSYHDQFYKQLAYYFQAHFSMFVPPGSRRIGLAHSSDGGLDNVAFVTPQKEYVVVLINYANATVTAEIRHAGKGNIDFTLSARSINTVIYK